MNLSFFIFIAFLVVLGTVESRVRSSNNHTAFKVWDEYDSKGTLIYNSSVADANRTIASVVEDIIEDNKPTLPPKPKVWDEYDSAGHLLNISNSTTVLPASVTIPTVTSLVSAASAPIAPINTHANAASIPAHTVEEVGRSPNASTIPVPSVGYKHHGQLIKDVVLRHSGGIGVVFLGDSTIAHIERNETFWRAFDTKYKAMNLGSPGERTEHLLYRLSDTDISDVKNVPVVAIMIGTLNVGAKDSAESVFLGIKAVVNRVASSWSNHTKIFVFSILPRRSSKLEPVVNATNLMLATEYQGLNSTATFVDLTGKFLADGELKESMFMPDLLHPSTLGYAAIVDSLVPTLDLSLKKTRRRRRNLRSLNL